MRNIFIKELVKKAEVNPDIYLLCGDLGFSVLEPFIDKFPNRYINVGICEQNMMGIASGLALSGKKVFTYSIVNFSIARCLEQIRNDICYHNVDVTIVSTGGGLAYGVQGYTHHGIEDIAFTRSLPNMDIYNPADEMELHYCMPKLLNKIGPNYLRLARGSEPKVHHMKIDSQKTLIEIFPKQHINLIVTGTPLKEAIEAVRELKKRIGLFSLPHLTSNSKSEILAIAKNSDFLITIEEHSIEGGLGSFVAESIAQLPKHACLIRKGIKHENMNMMGHQSFMRKKNEIDKEGIIKTILEIH